MTAALLAFVLMIQATGSPLPPLTADQISEAIALGSKGDVPIALVGRMLGISKGEFDVFVEGPMGRIAAAADSSFKQLRPFTAAHVTDEMKEPRCRVILRRTEHTSRYSTPKHIVLMPRRTKDLEQAIQRFGNLAGRRCGKRSSIGSLALSSTSWSRPTTGRRGTDNNGLPF